MNKEDISQQHIKDNFHYDPLTGILIRIKRSSNHLANSIVNYRNDCGYIKCNLFKVRLSGHHVAWMYMFGYWPSLLDHINGIKDDNRISNLREATPQQNNFNTSKRPMNSSGYKGVTYNKRKKKYIARIRCSGIAIDLGRFETAEHAAVVRLAAEYELFGEYMRDPENCS